MDPNLEKNIITTKTRLTHLLAIYRTVAPLAELVDYAVRLATDQQHIIETLARNENTDTVDRTVPSKTQSSAG
jgi:hypothetical protein